MNGNNNNNYDDDNDRISARAAQKHLEITHEISKILDCDLDRETLAVCISLLQNGVDPESLALVVKELKREAKRLRESREVQCKFDHSAGALSLCVSSSLRTGGNVFWVHCRDNCTDSPKN